MQRVWKNRDFQPTACYISEMIQDTTIGTTRTIGNHTQAFRLYHFQWPSVTPDPAFKVTPLFDADYLRNVTRYSFSGILIGAYSVRRPCSDFMDMLRRLISCRIIIIIIIIIIHALLKGVTSIFEWSWVTWRNIQWHKARADSLQQLSFLLYDYRCPVIVSAACWLWSEATC